VERGLIDLDESISKILPELDHKEILKSDSASGPTSEASKNSITPRHLLTHTSGLSYRSSHPLLVKWTRETQEGQKFRQSRRVEQVHNTPLVFEPGCGWIYGTSLDWAGLAVRRLHRSISLEDYFIENIWKVLGLCAPFPTFCLSDNPEYKARVMEAAESTAEGLKPFEWKLADNPEDQDGGAGLALTTKDFVAVLVDLISDSPKLLKPETMSLMFTPQLAAGSPAEAALVHNREEWDLVSGPILQSAVNHGLGGVLALSEAPDIGQPKNILAWAGISGPLWFASRELGVAGFFATQLSPYGSPAVTELINAWRKDFWTKYNSAA
jgi:CubicO group peptidase (beta-lactamase class C family)